MGACTGIVGLFKQLIRVTAHPQLLELELRAPTGTCPGHYGITIQINCGIIINVFDLGVGKMKVIHCQFEMVINVYCTVGHLCFYFVYELLTTAC